MISGIAPMVLVLFAFLAQLVEHLTCNEDVIRSIRIGSSHALTLSRLAQRQSTGPTHRVSRFRNSHRLLFIPFVLKVIFKFFKLIAEEAQPDRARVS